MAIGVNLIAEGSEPFFWLVLRLRHYLVHENRISILYKVNLTNNTTALVELDPYNLTSVTALNRDSEYLKPD